MPDSKITALTSISTSTDPANDPLVIVDVSDTSMAGTGTTKKVTLNQLLGASGTATLASATITGDLTARNWFVTGGSLPGVGNGNPFAYRIGGGGLGIGAATETGTTAPIVFYAGQGGIEQYRIAPLGVNTWSDGAGGTRMTLNSTGLGVGKTPLARLDVASARAASVIGGIVGTTGTGVVADECQFLIKNVNTASGQNNGAGIGGLLEASASNKSSLLFYVDSGTAVTNVGRFDSAGNLGIGVQPTTIVGASGANGKGLQGDSWTISSLQGLNESYLGNNLYSSAYNVWSNRVNAASGAYYITGGTHIFLRGAAQAAGTITPTESARIDATGNLLVGTTSGSFHRILKNSAAGTPIMDWVNFGSNGAVAVCTVDRQTYSSANAAACALRVGDAVGARSINASGTINASGADYAEYMTKSGDFTIAKGDVAGIDANGKLTNVFSNAVSFVVKSTDPSYVGNDKWGTGIEGDALESARQLVDRIAFAGQVPVNVTGANAGDYIVPVVDGTGIKGIAVTSPTFEQYQIAVGKVIAIDADGRARIIVKVA